MTGDPGGRPAGAAERAIVVDDWALQAIPGLERDLARGGALVMRSFKGLPNPHLLRRYRGAAVVGGPDRTGSGELTETQVRRPPSAALARATAEPGGTSVETAISRENDRAVHMPWLFLCPTGHQGPLLPRARRGPVSAPGDGRTLAGRR